MNNIGHEELMKRMISQCGDQLRELGEHGLADGTEEFRPDLFIDKAVKFHKGKQVLKARPKKNKSQKQARRNNRK